MRTHSVAGPPAEGASESVPGVAKGLLAAGGLLGAVLASSCCIVPLLLVTLGIGGAWMGNLTALAPYKPYFVVATLVFLGLGYWQVYFKPKPVCELDRYCASPTSGRVTQVALWLASVWVLLAITINYWAPFFY